MQKYMLCVEYVKIYMYIEYSLVILLMCDVTGSHP